MSDAELDPHVLISAKIGGAQKILALPSHRSRWGWVVMLGHAKLHRPPGRFDSLQQVRYLVGEFRDCVPAWIDAGLLHVVPNLCRCLSQVDDPKRDELVVHDWKAHQERRSRTTSWRDEKGIPSGHVNLSTVSPDVSPSVSPVVSPPPVYADAHGRQSQSLSTSSSTEGGPGGTPFPNIDAEAQTFLEGVTARHIRQAGDKQLAEYDRQIEAHGLPAVIRAYQRCAKAISGTPTATQLVWSGRKVLEPFVDTKMLAAEDRSEEQENASRRKAEATWKRRIEAYQSGGRWDPAWGEPPVEAA